MAPVVWGLPLAEIKWSKFKSSYMWNREYHLRRTKFIVYQLAMIFCVVSESLGTAALSDYVDQQKLIQRLDDQALEYNDNYIGVASYNIFAGIFVATIFGAAFFFDLFWPEREEDKSVRISWKACAVLANVLIYASAFALTVITVTEYGYVGGVSPARAQELLSHFHKDGGAPLKYVNNGRCLAAVVFIWPGAVATTASAILMFFSINHNERQGPLSTHARKHREAKEDPEQGFEDADPADPEKAVAHPDREQASLQYSNGIDAAADASARPAGASVDAVHGARAA